MGNHTLHVYLSLARHAFLMAVTVVNAALCGVIPHSLVHVYQSFPYSLPHRSAWNKTVQQVILKSQYKCTRIPAITEQKTFSLINTIFWQSEIH
jgi:predicted SprT family Zn-dependent metalloprotease